MQIRERDANLNIGVLAILRDLPVDSGTIIL
jgi:hypothetical protein